MALPVTTLRYRSESDHAVMSYISAYFLRQISDFADEGVWTPLQRFALSYCTFILSFPLATLKHVMAICAARIVPGAHACEHIMLFYLLPDSLLNTCFVRSQGVVSVLLALH